MVYKICMLLDNMRRHDPELSIIFWFACILSVFQKIRSFRSTTSFDISPFLLAHHQFFDEASNEIFMISMSYEITISKLTRIVDKFKKKYQKRTTNAIVNISI